MIVDLLLLLKKPLSINGELWKEALLTVARMGTWEAGTDKESVCRHTATVCILGAKGLQLRNTQGPIGISTINSQFKFSSLAGLYWGPAPPRMPTDHPFCPLQGSRNFGRECKTRQRKMD